MIAAIRATFDNDTIFFYSHAWYCFMWAYFMYPRRSYKVASGDTVATYKIPYSRKNSNPMGKVIISIQTNKEMPSLCKITSQYFDFKSNYANFSEIMAF